MTALTATDPQWWLVFWVFLGSFAVGLIGVAITPRRRNYGPRVTYGPLDEHTETWWPFDAPEFVRADPFETTRAQIAALPTAEETR